jgi:5-methylcytosine-specific restriction enzyme subunit McrC
VTHKPDLVVDLQEYRPTYLPAQALPQIIAEKIYTTYGSQVTIEPPSFRNENRWELVSQGSVGYIPVADEVGLRLHPKVPVRNIVRMLEYAYGLQSLQFFDELATCSSLQEFFSELASILARRVLDRARRGFHRAYIHQEENLPYLRGRLDIGAIAARPWATKFDCRFEDHLADIRENQLLAWSLMAILRSGYCNEEVLPFVRHAYHSVQSFTSVIPFDPQDCVGWNYNRLNVDYGPMHALCRFFLDHSSPSHQVGEDSTTPFLVDMAALYERFVAEWLRIHLPPHLSLEIQENVETGSNGEVCFRIDLVIYDAQASQVRWVLDTKYKAPPKPSSDDVSQVVTYAQLKGSKQAALVYPTRLEQPYLGKLGNVHVASLTFPLAGDLEPNGQDFLRALLGTLPKLT